MCRAVFLFHTYVIRTPSIPPQLAVVRPSLFAHMVCTNSNLTTPRNGTSRAPAPTIMHYFAMPQNRCRSLRILPSIRKHKKAVQSFSLRHRFVLSFSLFFFYCLSAPLSRLAPIEALPQTPTGLCPVPTMGFTP